VTLVNNNEVVAHFTQVDFLRCHHSVTRDKDAALLTQCTHLLLTVGFLFVVKLHDVVNFGTPLLQLVFPVYFQCGRNDNEYLRDLFRLEKSFAESSHLDCLSKSHVVTEHASFLVAIQVVQPDYSFLLMLKEPLINFSGEAEVIHKTVLLLLSIELKPTCVLSLRQDQLLIRVNLILVFFFFFFFYYSGISLRLQIGAFLCGVMGLIDKLLLFTVNLTFLQTASLVCINLFTSIVVDEIAFVLVLRRATGIVFHAARLRLFVGALLAMAIPFKALFCRFLCTIVQI
jgi:hypothetical protein